MNFSKQGLAWGVRSIGVSLAMLALAGCVTTGTRGSAVPTALAEQAGIPGSKVDADIRYWGDEAAEMKSAALRSTGDGSVDYLTLSGGGINGAYGAGYLVGWTAKGDRPEFEVVTGISVGAMIAPMAFLGPRYDSRLQAIFADLATQRSPALDFVSALLGAPSIASNRPLINAIARLVDAQALAEIAVEHGKGRRLLIGTTNLDAERPMVWDIGAIAASAIPNKLRLVQQIILASASVPGIYPPVLINVAAGGKGYDELHVDGGVTQNLVLLPGGFDALPGAGSRNRHLYVIYNGTVEPTREPVQMTSASILGRSIPTLLKYRGRSDIALLSAMVERSGIDYNLTAMPPDFPATTNLFGSPEWLVTLYNYGVESGKAGAWQREN
ncbi:MAG: hypothetical protein JWR39_222 [Devosia sp.]|nr:hypothetical protein [Devosia sp.]